MQSVRTWREYFATRDLSFVRKKLDFADNFHFLWIVTSIVYKKFCKDFKFLKNVICTQIVNKIGFDMLNMACCLSSHAWFNHLRKEKTLC